MKRPDLLILIAIWQFFSAFMALGGLAAVGVFAFPAVLALWGSALVGGLFGLSIAVLVLLALIGLGVAGGIGLLLGKEWGRILAIVNAALNLLNFPIGTIIGILVLVYLTKTEVRDYFRGAGQ